MKRLALLTVLFFLGVVPAFGQIGVRFGDGTPVISGQVSGGPIFTVPLAGIRFCNSPAVNVPCTNLAITYTDATLTNACPSSTQIVLAATNNCVGTTDLFGNWGVWVQPGTYTYTIQLPKGGSIGPYTVTVGGGAGTNILPLANTFTNVNNFTGGFNINGLPGVAGNGTFTIGDCVNVFSLVPLQVSDTGSACGSGGGGGSVIASPQFQIPYYPTVGSVPTVQGSSLTTDATGDITIPGTTTVGGPNPYVDAVSFGAFAAPSVAQSVASCNGTSTITLTGGVSTFKNKEGITVEGCGATNSLAQPAFPTVTPVVAHVGTGTGNVVGGIAGSTTSQYCIVGRDKGQGLTQCSDTTGTNGQITNGASTLGPVIVNITSMARANNVVTVTCAAPCGVSTGAEIYVTNSSDPSFSGFFNATTFIDSLHFSISTGQDTREGATTSATGGTLTVYNANHLTIPTTAYQYYIYKFNGTNYVYDGIVRPGETTWDDFGQTPPARPLWVPNIAPTSPTNDSLTTTIVSGGGTSSLVLANAASQTISGQVAIKDDAPTFLAAYASASGSTTASPMRISSAANNTNYVFNSYSLWTGGVPATVQDGHKIVLNDTLATQSGVNMTGIMGGTSNSGGGGFSSGFYPQIQVGTAYPGIAAGSTSSQFNYLAFIALNDNALIMTVGPGGGFDFSLNNVSCTLTGTDTMGMCLVSYGVTQEFFNNDLFSVNDSLPYGYSLTPIVYLRNDIPNLNGSGDMRMEGTSWVGRGFDIDSAVPSGGLNNYAFYDNYCQACRTPFITVGSLNAPTVTVRGFTNDTSSTADIANEGANQLNAILDGVADNSKETNGIPGLTTGSQFASIQINSPATQVGQNVNLSRFRTDVSLDGIGTTPSPGTLQDFQSEVRFGQSYSWQFPLSGPSGVSTVVCLSGPSCGGSVPIGTWTYGVTANGPDGRSSGLSQTTGICTTTSGSQTCDSSWSALTGAVSYSVYRSNGGGFGGVVACLNTTALTCHDIASSAGGGSPPATGTAGTTYATATSLGTQSVVLVGPAGAAVSPTCTLTFSTNTCGWSGGGGGFTAGGDLSGTSTSQQVIGLRGLALPSLGAATGYLYDSAGTLSLSTSASNFTSGTLPHPQLPTLLSADIPNNAANTSGNAATATALASAPTLCSTGFAPTGVLASGNATGCASIASGLTTQTNTVNNISQSTLNLINSAAFNGLTFTFTNTGTGVVQAGFTGTLGNAGLTNSSTTVNGQGCSLGGTCTVPFTVNGSANTSQAGVNFLTSTVNAAGLTVTPSNPSTNSVKFEVTGSLTSTYPQTVSGGVSGGIPCFTSTTTAVASTLFGSGQFVLGGGAGNCPTTSFSVVPIANGGTGAATATAHQWFGRPQGTTGAPSFSLLGTSDTTPPQCAADSGAANVYVLTLAPAATALVNGLEVCFTPANNNTSTTPTLNVSGLGAATISNPGGSALITNQLNTASIAVLRYNAVSTDWELQGGGTGGGGSGTINAGSQFSLSYYSLVGSATTLSAVNSPASPNGQTYFVCSTPSAGAATTPAFCLPGVPGRAVSGTTDTILFTDRTSLVTYTSNSAVAVTLPQAGSSNFGSNFPFLMRYVGTSILTVTPTTSTVNGQATVTLGQNDFCFFYSIDNTNYLANCTNGAGTNPVVADSGSANAYVIAYPLLQEISGGTTIPTGATIYFTVGNANTGASTINVNGFGVKGLTKNGAAALITGDLVTSTIYGAIYDGTQWQVIKTSAGDFNTFTAHKWFGNNTSGTAAAAPSSIGSSDVFPNIAATDSGVANAYIVAPSTPVTSLAFGATVFFTTANANSGASTINVSSLGVKALDKKGATALVTGDILATATYMAVYDGTEWQLIDPSTTAGGSGTVGNCTVAKALAYYSATGTTTACLSEADLTQYLGIADSGTANAYVLTLTVPLASLNTFNSITFTTTHPNTTASTVNVSGLGVKNITKNGTGALIGGEILSGVIYTLQWDGTEWQLLNPSSAGGGVAVHHLDLTGQTANAGPTTLVTPSSNGWFVPACYVVTTTAAGTSGTMPKCQINYTDADSGVAQTPSGPTSANPTPGTIVSLTSGTNAANGGFYAASGVAISCQTLNYVSVGSPVLTYAVHCSVTGPYY